MERYYLRACPRCSTGTVKVDPDAHRFGMDEAAVCVNCAWRPVVHPLPSVYPQTLAEPRHRYQPWEPDDEKPPKLIEKQRRIELQGKLARLNSRGLSRNEMARRLHVSTRTVRRWLVNMQSAADWLRDEP